MTWAYLCFWVPGLRRLIPFSCRFEVNILVPCPLVCRSGNPSNEAGPGRTEDEKSSRRVSFHDDSEMISAAVADALVTVVLSAPCSPAERQLLDALPRILPQLQLLYAVLRGSHAKLQADLRNMQEILREVMERFRVDQLPRIAQEMECRLVERETAFEEERARMGLQFHQVSSQLIDCLLDLLIDWIRLIFHCLNRL